MSGGPPAPASAKTAAHFAKKDSKPPGVMRSQWRPGASPAFWKVWTAPRGT